MVTRCIESDTCPVLEGEREKSIKLSTKAPVNGSRNSNGQLDYKQIQKIVVKDTLALLHNNTKKRFR